MPAARPRVWLALPLLGVGAAMVADVVRVLVQPVGSASDTIFEILLLAALLAALLVALRAWMVGRARLDAAEAQAEQHRALAGAAAEVIGGAGEALVVIDDQATISVFNRAAERMFGYTADEMIGASLERLMTEGGRKAHAAYLAETGVTAMVEAAKLRTTHRGVRKTGEVFPFELVMTEWSDEGRRMFTGVLRDVTRRERTADDVKEAEARYLGLFEAVGDPLFVFVVAGDGGFVLESMNQAAETTSGLSRFAVSGWTPEKLGKDDGRALKRALLAALSAGQGVDAEVPALSPDRSGKAQVRVSPLRNGAGEIHRLVVQVREPVPAPA